ncbi:hypothetical protein EYF80_030718 [Liparis tanakae]|uniref:Uncharacterized protein n=1 Tax=Liparis tanakae TaxID=230148 RepID=A0A4Z2H2P0_9TELE|nr:hypothetical protein EYF80_030718 [Liparis tanakae]
MRWNDTREHVARRSRRKDARRVKTGCFSEGLPSGAADSGTRSIHSGILRGPASPNGGWEAAEWPRRRREDDV